MNTDYLIDEILLADESFFTPSPTSSRPLPLPLPHNDTPSFPSQLLSSSGSGGSGGESGVDVTASQVFTGTSDLHINPWSETV